LKGFESKILIFASAKKPIRVTCLPEEEEVNKQKFQFMFKYGDDLRQDNLVLQMFKMMDRFWAEEGLGIDMVTYDVMETGFEIGMMQFV
jgi:phosphatidylinositol 3-kinase